MYGRMYTSRVAAVAVTAAQDFFEINAPSTGVVVIHRIFIGQYSDAADAQAEMLSVLIQRGGGTAGSGGSVPVAAPHNLGHAAFGGTTEANNTTASGTPVPIFAEAFNVQAGYFWVPTPEERIIVPPSGILVVTITAPNDSLTMNGSITFEEID